MHTHEARRRAVMGGAVMLCLCAVPAPTASRQTSAPRTVEVAIDFRAISRGVPVLDLKADEIDLRVDGVQQDVRGLTLVRLDGVRTPAPFATNVGTGRRRDVIFAIDEESLDAGAESSLRDALTAMLRTLTPADRVGLVSLHASGPTVGLTAGRAGVQAAIPLVRGRAISRESAIDLACRTRRVLPAISSLIQGLDAGPTTTVLLFSAALAAPTTPGVSPRGAASGCLLLPTEFDRFSAVAMRSAAQLYAIRVVDAARPDDPAWGAGLEKLAGESFGQFVTLIGDPDPQMQRIASETSSFYTASIAVAAGRDAPRRPVELRIRRDGVTARVRPDFVLPPLESRTTSPRDMLRVGTVFRALPLQASGFPSRHSTRETKVVVLFEPTDPSVPLASAMAGFFDETGKLVAQWTADRDDLAARPVAAALIVAPGTYRLRVAAVDSNGRSGSVDDEIRVVLPAAGSVTTSAVVLGAPLATGFSPRLQFTASDPSAVVYLEVYGAAPCSTLSAQLALAASELAPALATAAASATLAEGSDACILFGGFELTHVVPGDYTVRIDLQQNGRTIGQRLRTLRRRG